METLKKSLLKASKVALISIHPEYAEKIVSGEKRYEFRRGWTQRAVEFLVIYATAPVKRLVAITEIEQVHKGNVSRLWELAQEGGGVTQQALYAYMEGKDEGVAIEIKTTTILGSGLVPTSVLGKKFRAPQSFRYLDRDEITAINNEF